MTRTRTGSPTSVGASQSAFVRGFIDDLEASDDDVRPLLSQSAFVRGFIDDMDEILEACAKHCSLNPRSCAASSMTPAVRKVHEVQRESQSAFVRGFIDDRERTKSGRGLQVVSIRVRARLHR